MIQLLFAGVFLITVFPVLVRLCLSAKLVEAFLNRLGFAPRFLVASFFTLIALAQLNWLANGRVFNFFQLLNRSVFYYLIDVPIHETGHFMFLPLGEISSVFGGSFLEVAVPAGLFLFFLLRACPRLATFMLFFVGHHLVHVAEYMSTARRRSELVMLSLEQNPDMHDWYILFNRWGVLEHDVEFANLTRYAALVILLLALLLMLFPLRQASNNIEVAAPLNDALN